MSGTTETYLAFDLGAESGRAFLGSSRRKETARRSAKSIASPTNPSNTPAPCIGTLRASGSKCARLSPLSKRPDSSRLAGIGVDAWGVDYALLGQRGELLPKPFHYRDARNISAFEGEVLALMSRADISTAPPAFS